MGVYRDPKFVLRNKWTAPYTYIHSRKTNTFTFSPQAYMENFEKCAKRKRKKHFISLHCPMLSVVVFPPLFLNLSLYVILDIPEVPEDSQKKVCKNVGRGGRYINNLKNS